MKSPPLITSPVRLICSIAFLFGGIHLGAIGQESAVGPSKTEVIEAAHLYLLKATKQYGDAVTITIDPPSANTRMAACDHYEFFLPAGTRLWGKIHLGVKCERPAVWTAYLQSSISVQGHYLRSARKINRGQPILESDIEITRGDLTTLPARYLTEAHQAVGRITKSTLASKQALTHDQLLQPAVIKQGQKVKVLVGGATFTASVSGVALQSAGEGESIKVRTESGRTLTGIARSNGSVEISP